MSVVEFNIYQGILTEMEDKSCEVVFVENKFVFKSNEFCFNVNADAGYILLDKKTFAMMSEFYPKAYVEGGIIKLITTKKHENGGIYVSRFVNNIKVDGREVFNIQDYQFELTTYENHDYAEVLLGLKESNPTLYINGKNVYKI